MAALTSAAVGPHSNVGSAHVNGLILAAFARARSAFLTCCDNLMISIHLFSRARSSASSQPPGLSWTPRRHPSGSVRGEEHDDDDWECLEVSDDADASEEELPTELSSSSVVARRGPAPEEAGSLLIFLAAAAVLFFFVFVSSPSPPRSLRPSSSSKTASTFLLSIFIVCYQMLNTVLFPERKFWWDNVIVYVNRVVIGCYE